jgi:signal transduction histidine kinase
MAPPDPLTELRERVQAAQEAAERLAGEARHETRDELEALIGLLRTLREVVPAELQQQLTETIRQVLLLVRALIDFWVERLETPRPEAVEVEDIPID